MELGKFIATARKQAGVSQYYLAVTIGYVSAQPISNIERGMQGLPPKHVHTIARELGIDPEELISKMSFDRRRRIIPEKV